MTKKRPPLRPLPFEASAPLILRELRQFLLRDTNEWFDSYCRPSCGNTVSVDDWLSRIEEFPLRWTVSLRLLPAPQLEKLKPDAFVRHVIADARRHR